MMSSGDDMTVWQKFWMVVVAAALIAALSLIGGAYLLAAHEAGASFCQRK
jgi:predicted small integral membrane protein